MVNLLRQKPGSVHELSIEVHDNDISDNLPPENEPLLPRSPLTTTTTTSKSIKERDHYYTYLRIYAIIFLVNIAYQILTPAQTQIYEDIYCRQYYSSHSTTTSSLILPTNNSTSPPPPSPSQQLCKIAPIQQHVSSLKGWLEFWDALPSLLMAIPIGILSDLYGRRPFFNLCFSVILLQQSWITLVTLIPKHIPLEATLWKGALNFCSGGVITAEMLFAVMVTDITPQEKMGNVFFMANGVGISTKIVGPLVAASLMKYSAWWAVGVGMVCLVVILPLVATAPETLPQKAHQSTINGRDDDDDGDDDDEPSSPAHIYNSSNKSKTKFRTALTRTTRAFKELALVWRDPRLLFLIALYPFRMMTNALSDLLNRYVSLRYNWSLADATFLYSLQAVTSTLLLFLVMPRISDLLEMRWGLSAISKNALLSRAALVVMAVAFVIEGYAPRVWVLIVGLIVETFSSSLSSTLRALAGCMVEARDNGRVFSVLAISETVSNMIAFPATSWLFNKALEKGERTWLGLPFFVTAGLAAVGAAGMMCVRFEGSKKSAEREDGGG